MADAPRGNNSIGIMQGRLSSSEGDRIQFFPDDWPAEFMLAKEMGFDHIQWFLDVDKLGSDPGDIWKSVDELTKVDEVRAVTPISSVDCGFFIISEDGQTISEKFKEMMAAMAGRLKTGVISVPLLEKNAPKSKEEKEKAWHLIDQLAAIAEPLKLNIALETEMPADELVTFIDSFNRSNVGVTYDIGNNTSYGFDCPAEIALLGSRILEVHLKDRKIGTTQSVLLGSGDGDFDGCFAVLARMSYTGAFTLQAWRTKDYLADAKNQLAFAREKLLKHFNEL